MKSFILNTILFLSCTVYLASAVAPRIIGGNFVTNEEFPYVVQISSSDHFICGATIIGRKWILTADHCVPRKPRKYRVHYGSVKLLGGRKIKVSKIFRKLEDDDIAILKLKSPIPDPYYVKVQLPPQNGSFPSVVSNATVLGWGYTSADDYILAPVLKKLTVQAFSAKECRRRYPEKAVYVHDKSVCVLGRKGMEGKEGSCYGDSGGPLIINGFQYGITSYGLDAKCLEAPDGYMLVPAYRNWIDSVIRRK